MTENWIKEAFEKAERENSRITPFAVSISEFLNKNSPAILEKWSQIVGQEKALKFAKMLSTDDDLSDICGTLTECFTVAGYLFCMMEHKR